MPQMLTDEMEMQRKITCAELLKHYEEEGEKSFSGLSQGMSPGYNIMTLRANVNRWNIIIHMHKSSPSPRKFKVVASARKVMHTRPHTSRQTEVALHKMNLGRLPHPFYRSELALSDFYLFPKIKEHIRGNHYEIDEDVEAAVRPWFRQKCVDFFTDGMRQLVHRW
ncbi:histone-lysine N-methyltransferase SETMAR [Elysia marginata]|uniref:Histone-lysine N-methyltransferase SETMAR n=1 Tax=Elysia marginata TaxID=1093978 RepID=A0AAV4H956_9GAST|nr:histone-lysine N-methyltransferase SETMAR [Elysia marginata]